MTEIQRQFVRLKEGLVHYREAGSQHGGVPVLMLHASPASSQFLEPLMLELATTRRVIAPDTLGNGDSAPPLPAEPDLAYYGDSMDRLLTALKVEVCDVYGTHTGSHIGIELACQSPQRLRRLAMHGVAVLSAQDQADFLAHYAPPQQPDDIGSQFNWAWHYVRDQMIFYPHFRKTADCIRSGGRLDPDFLHTLTLGVLKNLTHYHKTYHAVFRHPILERLSQVTVPVCLITHPHDPLAPAVETVVAHCPDVEVLALTEASPAAECAALAPWLAPWLATSTAPV